MSRLLITIVAALSPSLALAGKVAVFDPQKGTSELRFTMEPKRYDAVAQTLRAGGLAVERLTGAQIEQRGIDPAVFDSFVLIGPAVPRDALAPLKAFADAGGVIISLETSTPFLIATATNPDGTWTMSPKEPKFAWQSAELLQHFGMEYIHLPAQHDAGVRHDPTDLLKRYLADAPSVPPGRRASRWVVPHRKPELRGVYHPLIRSRRADDADTVPQIGIAKRENRHAIFAIDPVFTRNDDPRTWNAGDKTVVALARVAEDLRSGKLRLAASEAIPLDANQPLPEPLAQRLVVGEVAPAGADPIVRFGKFDGSSLELATGHTVAALPRRLDPGQAVSLDVPPAGGKPIYLRARFAYLKSGAVLHASIGETTVLRERLSYYDASGQGNYDAPGLTGVAAEIQRVAYAGESVSGKLQLANEGTEPLWFDAVQLETRPAARPMSLGLGAGQEVGLQGIKSPIDPAITHTWPRVRASARLNNIGAPDDPNRWKVVDKLLGAQMAMSDHLEVIIEGTPQWAAISPERYALGLQAKRPHTVPPDPEKYVTIVRDLIQRHGDKIDAYEIWNEANIQQFWRGTPAEFATLHNAIVRTVRQHDPSATIICGGMAGVADEFFSTLYNNGCLANVDQIAIHPYAGTSPAWDIVYGQLEGELFAHGISTQIYSNESGFPYTPTEWFRNRVIEPNWQARMLSKAMSRLLAGDVTRLNVFHAGGGANPFGLFDPQGKPRPAYAVFDDYLRLALADGKQLHATLLPADDQPVDGVFVAGAQHEDGSISLVVNPSQRDELHGTETVIRGFDFLSLEGWTTFFGKAQAMNGTVVLTPDPGKSVGFYASRPIDAAITPSIRVVVIEAPGDLSLVAVVDKQEIALAPRLGVGATDIELPGALKRATGAVEFKFRASGKTVIDRIDLLDAQKKAVNRTSTTPPVKEHIPVRVRVPVDAGKKYRVETKSERPTPAAPKLEQAGGTLTLTFDCTGRTLVRLLPY